MKAYLPCLLGSFLFSPMAAFTQLTNPAQDTTKPVVKQTYVRCENTTQHELWLQKKDPTRKARRDVAIKMMNDIMAKQSAERTEATQYTIPVVVHVVYNTPTQKLSIGQVKTQIKVLNQDYNRKNPDTTKTPAAFKSAAGSMHVTFCLATVDPNGKATNGIVYKSTTTTSFSTDDAVKFTSQGGDDQWDPNKYLNIWVCNLGASLLGYGEFPTVPLDNTFGVVILYDAFGDSGTLLTTFNLGRTCSHEIGHCFNLIHTWGDDNGLCPSDPGGADDAVSDTPPEGNSKNDGFGNGSGPTFGCPTWPYTENCSTTSPGIMYDDFLDYTDDNCMNIFTKGQATRAAAAITGPMAALLTSTVCGAVGIQEYELSSLTVIYPNPSSGQFTVAFSFSNPVQLQLKVYNVLGQPVNEWNGNNITNETHTLDLSGQAAGIYFVRLSDGTNTIVKKLVVTK